MSSKENMTISELSLITGIPASTIRFYLREGLISPPMKKGKTRAYYTSEHVKRLMKLKLLRNRDKLSIEDIKRDHPFASKQTRNVAEPSSAIDRKDDIITTAIDLFRSKGYDDISINDIAEQAGISKATFYKHFSSKEDLFYECADKVFYNIDREFEELLNEKNAIKRLTLRTSLFIKTRRHMIDMLQLARGISLGGNRLKLKQIITNLTGPIVNDLEEGISQGFFRKMNTHVVAHLLMGAVEYGIYFLDGKNDSEIERYIEMGFSAIMRGVMQNPENRR